MVSGGQHRTLSITNINILNVDVYPHTMMIKKNDCIQLFFLSAFESVSTVVLKSLSHK